MSLPTISTQDLAEILQHSEGSLRALSGAQIFITGGTGFFGKWITQSLLSANQKFDLRLKVHLLCRSPQNSLNEQSWLGDKMFTLHQGDILDFTYLSEPFDFIIHAATSADDKFNKEFPDKMADVILNGTRRVLIQAQKSSQLAGKPPRFLFVSSGAVYGQQPITTSYVDEAYVGEPELLNPISAYGEAKRTAELYCQIANKNQEIILSVARCYAFMGPYLPLDKHFAAGNFTLDVLKDRPIVLRGDGSPYRSYMYPTDLIEWLLKILVTAPGGAIYNVGSSSRLTIGEFAAKVNAARSLIGGNSQPIQILGKTISPTIRNDYVCSVEKAKSEMNLTVRVSLDEAIKKTVLWYSRISDFSK